MPSIKQKSFTYKTSAVWNEGRSGSLQSDGKPAIHFSSPPEFKGDEGVWTPEDLFVAAVETCHMVTFLSFAARSHLHVISYQSHTNGVLECVDGDYRFTRIVIFPTVTVSKSIDEEQVKTILQDSHKHCLIVNSIASIVEVNPTIILQ
jgi:organic hydroperoxide reductase OsmC/OhrA